MKTLIAGSNGMVGSAAPRHLIVRKVLLMCGIFAALFYVGSDILAATRWEGYSYINQSVSELRAIEAPTRPFLMPILALYSVLEITFGWGVWISAAQKRSLRIAGVLLMSRNLYIVNSGYEEGGHRRTAKGQERAGFPGYFYDTRNLNRRQQVTRNNSPGVDEENGGTDSGGEAERQPNSQEAETELFVLFGASL